MKRTMKRTLCLTLAVIMIASLLCVGGFASGKKQYAHYVAIGDSIPAGYGLNAYGSSGSGSTPGDQLEANGTFVTDSYPAILKNSVGASSATQLARCGFRSVEVRMLLDSGYKGDSTHDYIISDLSQISNTQFAALQTAAVAAVKSADLITLNVGSNDVMTYALVRMEKYLAAQKAADKEALAAIETLLGSFDTQGAALINMLEMADNLKVTSQALAVLSAAMLTGYNTFKINWNAIVKDIHTLNPNAVVVAVGMYNPFRDLKLTNISLLKVGRLADQFVGLMNAYMIATPYAKYYTFVSVMAVQVYGFPALLDDEFQSTFIKNVHPTAEGHAYMAQQILSALPETDITASTRTGIIGKAISHLGDSFLAMK